MGQRAQARVHDAHPRDRAKQRADLEARRVLHRPEVEEGEQHRQEDRTRAALGANQERPHHRADEADHEQHEQERVRDRELAEPLAGPACDQHRRDRDEEDDVARLTPLVEVVGDVHGRRREDEDQGAAQPVGVRPQTPRLRLRRSEAVLPEGLQAGHWFERRGGGGNPEGHVLLIEERARGGRRRMIAEPLPAPVAGRSS